MMIRSNTMIKRERSVDVVVTSDYGEAVVFENHYRITARITASPNAEAELALCLSTLVKAGLIDAGKLRAALALAEPVAEEIAERRTEEGDGE